MRQTLQLHPDSLCFAVTHVEVEVARPRAHSLILTYVVIGKVSDLAMPPVVAAAPADELWRHTCFEAFIGGSPGTAYYEFNFAPSTQWAAYRFSGYRSGMRVATEFIAPRIELISSPGRCILQASLELHGLFSPASGGGDEGRTNWRLGLSAVIEEASGNLSYWALVHPSGKADFHHPDCFVLEVA
jgi:hypothetical protein